MLFKRKTSLPFIKKFFRFLWPVSGFKRAGKYLGLRLLRLQDDVNNVAVGLAFGVAVSFTPFVGFHIGLALLLTFLTRGNYLATLIGTLIGNPWTFPLTFLMMEKIANLMTGQNIIPEGWSFTLLVDAPWDFMSSSLPIIKFLALGSIPLFILSWLFTYLSAKLFLKRYKMKRIKEQN